MALRPLAAVLCGALVVGACSGDGATREAPAQKPSAPSASTDAIPRCAGFTVDKAAAILGVPASSLQDYSEMGRQCTFRSPTNPRLTVAFTVSPRQSESDAISSMASERETMGMAQRAIDGVTGTKSKDKPVEDVSQIGDDAFYSPMNGAIMMRVGRVIVQVISPADMAAKKRVAEEIVNGLRR